MAPQSLWGFDLSKQVVEYKLNNGMKWLFVVRHQAPVFSGVVTVRVGGADEAPGKTGLAHMFEHMAFKGSSQIGTKDFAKEKPILEEIERVGEELNKSVIEDLSKKMKELQKKADEFQIENEIWEVMSRNGGNDLNAYTSKDLTAYHVSLPVSRLELWANVVADMVFDPQYREFYIERNVVAEERRMRVENSPDGLLYERLLADAFADGPYHWGTIGYEKDISNLTIADARTFHGKYYVPNNMVGVLVGDFKVSEAKKIIEKTFGHYSAAKKPVLATDSGKTVGDIVKVFSYKAEPSLIVAFHKPTLPDQTEYTFDVINSLLCSGESSRLRKRLIYEKKMVQDVACSVSFPGARLNNLFSIWIDPLNKYSPDQILNEVSAELDSLKIKPVSLADLSRVEHQVTSGFVFSLGENMKLAQSLAEFETIFGDWHLLVNYPEKIKEVDSAKIMDVANKYFSEENRVVIERLKGSK